MASTLTTTLNAQLACALASSDALASAQYPLNLPSLLALSLATGTGANKADQLYSAQLTLAASATADINMYSFGAANDKVGNTLLLATVKVLIIQNLSATPGDYLVIGNNATSAAWISPFNDSEDRVKIRGGGTLILAAPDATGYAVVNTTNHLLHILNAGAGSVTYNLIVIGATV